MTAQRQSIVAPGMVAAAVVALTFVTVAIVQHHAGRPPFCTCGRVALWTGDVRGAENSQMLFDWYSPSHIVHGLLFYAAFVLAAGRAPVGARLAVATVIEGAWELAENAPAVIARYRAATIAFGYSGDSILNSLSDMACMVAGFLIARVLPWRGSIALGAALELVAMAAIRDNLTLNVVMLLHPVEAIRTWQAG